MLQGEAVVRHCRNHPCQQHKFEFPFGWLVLLLVATVDVVASRVLYYLALRRLQMSHHAILLTLSPVIAVLWSWLLFSEVPTWQGFLGGTAVLLGVAIVTRQQRKQVIAP